MRLPAFLICQQTSSSAQCSENRFSSKPFIPFSTGRRSSSAQSSIASREPPPGSGSPLSEAAFKDAATGRSRAQETIAPPGSRKTGTAAATLSSLSSAAAIASTAPGASSTRGSTNSSSSALAVLVPMLRARDLPKLRGSRRTVIPSNSSSTRPDPSPLPPSTRTTSISGRIVEASNAFRQRLSGSNWLCTTTTAATRGPFCSTVSDA